MKQKRRGKDEIVKMLQGAEAKISGGKTLENVAKDLGVSVPTFYLWRKKYGGGQGQADQGKRAKELEQENALLKRLVADQAMEILRLKETLAEV